MLTTTARMQKWCGSELCRSAVDCSLGILLSRRQKWQLAAAWVDRPRGLVAGSVCLDVIRGSTSTRLLETASACLEKRAFPEPMQGPLPAQESPQTAGQGRNWLIMRA